MDPELEGRNERRHRPRSYCNCQTCLAYSLSLVASIVIVHGFYLWYKNRNAAWLALPCLGVCLIFVGSCLYRCGARKLYTTNFGVAKRNRATKGGTFFESQLSLNMLPQCFSNTTTSRILHVNDHRYLILPTDAQPSTSSDTPVQNLVATADNEVNANKSNLDSNTGILADEEGQRRNSQVCVANECASGSEPSSSVPNNEPERAVASTSTPESHLEPAAASSAEESNNVSEVIDEHSLSDTSSVSSTAATIAIVAEQNELSAHTALIELNTSDSIGTGNSDSDSLPANEPPPSYDSIDFDSSSEEALVNNYRTL